MPNNAIIVKVLLHLDEIDFAQNYFAVQTRRAELVEQRLLEDERAKAREKLSQTEKLPSGILYELGVDSQGFAVIRSKALIMPLPAKKIINIRLLFIVYLPITASIIKSYELYFSE